MRIVHNLQSGVKSRKKGEGTKRHRWVRFRRLTDHCAPTHIESL